MAEAWRTENSITLFAKNVPDPMTTFDEIEQFPKAVRKSFTAQGFEKPTPIQAQAWPILLQKRDMVGIAKTGSGKTYAFMAPILTMLCAEYNEAATGPQVCVLAPTRELAQQIEEETKKILPKALSSICLYGGTSKGPQIQALQKGAQIVVATPGRLMDLCETGMTNLHSVQYLVLDEADRMLDLGFEPAVRAICAQIPRARQTTMFSATWPESIQDLANKFQKEVVRIHVGSTELLANDMVSQEFIFTRHDGAKLAELRKILTKWQGKRVLVFALFKKSVNYLEGQLRDFHPIAIHSDKTQEHRERMLATFKSTEGSILIATDVAARGLDVKELQVVVNYEFPLQVDDYVHRIGRTGRAGATGTSITIISDTEAYYDGFAARDLEKILEKANHKVPQQIAAKAENFRHRARPIKSSKEKIPEAPAFDGAAASKSIKFADSDDDEEQPPKKKARTE